MTRRAEAADTAAQDNRGGNGRAFERRGFVDGASEPAYEAVALREIWGLFSLALFVISLTSRYAVRLIPPEVPLLGRLPPDQFLAVAIVPVFSVLGIASALLAGRQRSTTGRIGFLLNLVVLGLSVGLLMLASLFFALR